MQILCWSTLVPKEIVIHSFRDAHAGCGSLEAQLGPEGLQAMKAAGMTDIQLLHVASRDYKLNCNWKVFCDNYLVC